MNKAASHAGLASRNASDSAPSKPEVTARNRNSTDIAAVAALQPAEAVTAKNSAPRETALSNATFQLKQRFNWPGILKCARK